MSHIAIALCPKTGSSGPVMCAVHREVELHMHACALWWPGAEEAGLPMYAAWPAHSTGSLATCNADGALAISPQLPSASVSFRQLPQLPQLPSASNRQL